MEKIRAGLAEQRSRARQKYRDELDVIRSRIALLTGRDKLLMDMHLNNGNSFRQLAELAGVSEGKMARRINRIRKGLIRGDYIKCLRNREMFSDEEMAIARDYLLSGLSIRKIADKQRISNYQIRRIVRRIKDVVQEIDRDEKL